MQRWSNVLFEHSFTLERVTRKQLPELMGGSLDKQIHDILKGHQTGPFWRLGKRLIHMSTSPANIIVDTCEIEVEMEGISSGCFCPSTRDCPPEYDDERELTYLSFIYLDKDSQQLSRTEVGDFEDLRDYQDTFEDELYEAEINMNE